MKRIKSSQANIIKISPTQAKQWTIASPFCSWQAKASSTGGGALIRPVFFFEKTLSTPSPLYHQPVKDQGGVWSVEHHYEPKHCYQPGVGGKAKKNCLRRIETVTSPTKRSLPIRGAVGGLVDKKEGGVWRENLSSTWGLSRTHIDKGGVNGKRRGGKYPLSNEQPGAKVQVWPVGHLYKATVWTKGIITQPLLGIYVTL